MGLILALRCSSDDAPDSFNQLRYHIEISEGVPMKVYNMLSRASYI